MNEYSMQDMDSVLRAAFKKIYEKSDSDGSVRIPFSPIAKKTLVEIRRGALEEGRRVAVFLPAMPAWEFGLHLIGSMARIPMWWMCNCWMEDQDWADITSAIYALKKTDMEVCEQPLTIYPQGYDRVYVIRSAKPPPG
jgi:hypothetical protein